LHTAAPNCVILDTSKEKGDPNMKTAKGTTCKGRHEKNGKVGAGVWDVYIINGRRYTVCAHQVGDGYCGALIDVTNLEQITVCCGIKANHISPT